MAGRGKRPSSPRGGHRYPRSARVGETLREIIAEELVRIDDDRLALVTITGIDVDDELNRAHVYFDSLAGEDGDAEIVEALNRHRVRLQGAIADQIRAKKTPILDFRPDIALRSAERIDNILREDRKRHPDPPAKTETAKTEMAKTEMAKTEMANTEMAKTEMAKTEMANTEMAKTEMDGEA